MKSVTIMIALMLNSMPKGAGMFAVLGYPEPVASADTNFHRGATLAELRAAARRRFLALGSASSGKLRLEDLPRAPIEKMLGLKR